MKRSYHRIIGTLAAATAAFAVAAVCGCGKEDAQKAKYYPSPEQTSMEEPTEAKPEFLPPVTHDEEKNVFLYEPDFDFMHPPVNESMDRHKRRPPRRPDAPDARERQDEPPAKDSCTDGEECPPDGEAEKDTKEQKRVPERKGRFRPTIETQNKSETQN